MNKPEISLSEYKIIIIMFIAGSSILLAPRELAIDADRDAWISAIIGVLCGLLIIGLYNSLGKRYPEQTVVEYIELLLGKWIGRVLSFVFMSSLFLLSILLVKYMADFVRSQVMPETPEAVISLLVMGIAMFGAMLGLATISRAAQLFFPWVILLFSLVLLLVAPEFDFDNIKPFFQNDFTHTIHASIHLISVPYLELVLILMIYPFVKGSPDQRNKGLLKAGWWGGFLIIVIVLETLLVLGPDLTSRSLFPSYSLAKRVSIGDFIERMEAIIGFVWFLTLYFKIVICFYVTSIGFSQVFRLRDYRILIIPLGLIVLGMGNVVYPNVTYQVNFIISVWPAYSLLYGLLFPLLLLLLSLFRGKRVTGKK